MMRVKSRMRMSANGAIFWAITGWMCAAAVAAGGEAGTPPRLDRLLASETVTATNGLQRKALDRQGKLGEERCALVLLDVVELSDFDRDDIVLPSDHRRKGRHRSRRLHRPRRRRRPTLRRCSAASVLVASTGYWWCTTTAFDRRSVPRVLARTKPAGVLLRRLVGANVLPPVSQWIVSNGASRDRTRNRRRPMLSFVRGGPPTEERGGVVAQHPEMAGG
uniref:KASH domain-containing protein n=1 Tax=Plectus sambesii TaxID=2011161 RepID=A0A914WXY8_9BILA